MAEQSNTTNPSAVDAALVDNLIDAVVYREHAHTYQRKSAQRDVEEARTVLLNAMQDRAR